jgi:calcium permeable stress-gated cation channel
LKNVFPRNNWLFFNNPAGLLFWGAVLAIVAILSNLSKLQHYLPFLSVLGSSVRAVLQGLLPVVVVMLFSVALHSLMDYTARVLEKRKSQFSVQQEIFKWYFLYQIANVYLLLLEGSIFGTLESAIKSPTSVFELISAALPAASAFFLNYIITTWLGAVPLVLLQPYQTVLLAWYRSTWIFNPLRITRRMLKNGPMLPFSLDYGTVLPDLLYVLCIVMLYWVIAPVVLPFSAAFFFCAYIAYKYQLVFVAIRQYESGGQFFYGLYSYSMTGMLSASVLFIVYMGIKEGILQAPLLIPLPFLVLYCWRYTEQEFREISKNMPYDTAVREDEDIGEGDRSHLLNRIATFNPGFFKQPNVSGPATIFPYPHRILNVPLLNANGALNEVYVNDIPPGVDPEIYVQKLRKDLLLDNQHNGEIGL